MERTGHVPLSKSVCLSVKHTLENTVPGTAEEAEKTLQQTFRYFFILFFSICQLLVSLLSSQVMEADEGLGVVPGWVMEAPII